jgi:hypothetical protein
MTMGVIVGGLGTLVPEKKGIIAEIVVRTWIAGCITCFLTACVAGKYLVISQAQVVYKLDMIFRLLFILYIVGLLFFSKKNILIPNVAEKNILILVDEKKII